MRNLSGRFEKLEFEHQDISYGNANIDTFGQPNLHCLEPNATLTVLYVFTNNKKVDRYLDEWKAATGF